MFDYGISSHDTKMTDSENLSDDLRDVIDLDEAAKRIPGGRDSVLKVAKMLLIECPKLTGQIDKAISNNDALRLQRAAHTLKGSANIFAAKRVSEAALQMESLGEAKDIEQARSSFADLEREVQRLVNAVEKLTNPEAD
jgi:HPt (histidine-containing phosphotransfer) domain-containing protein